MGQEYTVKTFEFPGMTVRVFSPILTEEERKKRMKAIYKAAENLLKEVERRK